MPHRKDSRYRHRDRNRDRYRKQCRIEGRIVDAGSAMTPKSIPIAIAIPIPKPMGAWIRPAVRGSNATPSKRGRPVLREDLDPDLLVM